MKGKNYAPEDKIRILREADTGKSILEVCREHNISGVSFHRLEAALRPDGEQARHAGSFTIDVLSEFSARRSGSGSA